VLNPARPDFHHGLLGYRAAWFMCHRIRYAMTEKRISKLSGTVEIDETYIGGKLRVGPQVDEVGKRPKDRVRAISNKVPVVALVERNGRVRSFPMERVTAENLKPILREHISQEARLNTDESNLYRFAKSRFAGHDVVNHSKYEYSRRETDGRLTTTNTVEGFFSLLKRGVYGTFHHVGKQHLHRYLSEFDFRYNSRETTDGERALLAIKGVTGKRIMYRDSCARA
jgi:transposase-like protein